MGSIKKFFSSLIRHNQYVLKKSEIEKSSPNEIGLYRYTRFELYTKKTDKNGTLVRAYRSTLVQDGVTCEDAMKNSISFKFDLNKDKSLLDKNENKNIQKTYYTLGHNEKMNTDTGGQVWKFEDGSYIEQEVTFTS
jgi:hypothetical protein